MWAQQGWGRILTDAHTGWSLRHWGLGTVLGTESDPPTWTPSTLPGLLSCPLAGPCAAPPHPVSPFLPILFYHFLFLSHHGINFSHIFGQVELGVSVPHSPVPLFPYHHKFPFIFGSLNIFIWKELRQAKLISLSSHFSHLISLSPTELKLGTLPPPRTLVSCLFEVRATVTDTVFNCTYRCLLSIFTVNFI